KVLEAWTFFWAILDFWGIPRPPVDIVTGFVTDSETGLPINGATVSIADQEYTTDTYESLFRFYSSNPDLLRNGFYYIEGVGSNPLPITVSAEGYHTSFFDFVQPTDTFFTFFDVQLVSSTPPRVVSSAPADGEGAFRIVNPIVIDFSRPMDRASVESAFTIEPTTTGRFLWSNNDFSLTFRADSLPPLTPMTLTIGGAALGALGDPFDGNGDGTGGDDFVVSFTTGPADTQAPGIADTYPSIRATGVELDPVISIVMNEVLDAPSVASNQVEMVTASGDPVAGLLDHLVVGERSVLSFFPGSPLLPLESYIVRVRPGLRDLVGNVRTTQQQFNFSTGDLAVERTIIDDFETDAEVNWWPPEQSGSTTGIMPGVTARTTETQVVNLGSGSTAALRISVEWEEGASTTLLREYLSGGAPKSVVFDSTHAIEAYVFGDGSGTLFRFAVDDRLPLTAAEYHEVSPWFVVDWYGWRLVSWRPGRDGTGLWLGDGVLNGNLRIDSIQLSRSASGGNPASVVVDDLSLARRGTATSVESPDELPEEFSLLQNYPNPFRGSTTLQLNLPEPGPLTVSVYNILGAEVAR
ncbi:MAG: Ig-like domain-containing protein, partial [Rhodothermales bacterium]|nr:Ig-like domain-containing protein [Rhodothermales bacterium]